MRYRIYYTTGPRIIFGAYKTFPVDMGPLPYKNDWLIKKFTRDCAAAGKTFIKFERLKKGVFE